MLLDVLKKNYELKNDAEISRKLDVAPPIISRIRNGKCSASAEIIIKIHEVFGMSIADIKSHL